MDILVILTMSGIRKTFPGVVALDHVDFELRAGEVHVLLGENGAGKSTLMKILSGAHQKTAGRLCLHGREVEIKSPKHALALGISTIYQEFNLISTLTAGENIFLGREPLRFAGVIDYRKLFQSAQKILDDLGAAISARARVKDLGVAQKQMVEVAKALSLDAKILIMDEPTSALTEHEIKELFAAIRRMKARGVGIIYISHRLEEIFEIGDRVTVLRDGKCVGTRDIQQVTRLQLITMMVNRELAQQYPKQTAAPGEEILRVEKVSAPGVLTNIHFSLRRGEVLGIAGLLGSGRTELARAIFGVQAIRSGQIYIKNIPRRIRSPRAAIALGMGFLTEDRASQGLMLGRSVKENIVLPSLGKLCKWGVIKQKEEAAAAGHFVNELRIKTPGLNQRVMFLSGGNQQKVVLSKWLCRQADIFIFDEPTRGIDVGSKVEIYHFINRLAADGAGIIMISSELPEILGMSDRILVMHQGRITGEFSAAEAAQEKILQCALGERHVN